MQPLSFGCQGQKTPKNAENTGVFPKNLVGRQKIKKSGITTRCASLSSTHDLIIRNSQHVRGQSWWPKTAKSNKNRDKSDKSDTCSGLTEFM